MTQFPLYIKSNYGYPTRAVYDWHGDANKKDSEISEATEQDWQDAYGYAGSVIEELESKHLQTCYAYTSTKVRMERFENGERTVNLIRNLWRCNWG